MNRVFSVMFLLVIVAMTGKVVLPDHAPEYMGIMAFSTGWAADG